TAWSRPRPASAASRQCSWTCSTRRADRSPWRCRCSAARASSASSRREQMRTGEEKRRRGAGVSWQLSLKEHTRPGTRGTNDDILTKRIDDRQRRVIFRCEWPGRDYAYLVTRRIPLAPEAFHAQRVAWCCGSVAESSGWSGAGLRQETDKAEHSHHPVRRPWLRRLSLLRSSVD